MRLAPHLLVPAPPPSGCLDLLIGWLRWALKWGLLVGATALVTYALTVGRCPGPGVKMLASVGAGAIGIILIGYVLLKLISGMRQE